MIVNLDRKLVFIVGHYKSGSSWLDNLLSLHPDVRGLRETNIFHYAVMEPDPDNLTALLFQLSPWGRGGLKGFIRHRVADLARPVLNYRKATLGPRDRPTTRFDLTVLQQLALKSELLTSTSTEDLCRRFFGFLYSCLNPRRYLLEKTPGNIFYVGKIRSIFPGAKLIAIYRDGRDVVVSDKYFTANEHGKAVHFADSAHAWADAMEAQAKCAQAHNVYTLSYESLLHSGEAVLKGLLEFLELDASPAIMADMLWRSSFKFTTNREPGTEDPKDFYRKGVSGDWRNHFSQEDKGVFKELCGDLLIQLGYEKNHDW